MQALQQNLPFLPVQTLARTHQYEVVAVVVEVGVEGVRKVEGATKKDQIKEVPRVAVGDQPHLYHLNEYENFREILFTFQCYEDQLNIRSNV